MAHILIVDDEEPLARNSARSLARVGHEVRVAGTAAQGLALFQAQPSDIVLLDHRLPDATGLDLIGRLRAADESVLIVMITGHGSIDLAVQAMKAGASDLLTKPVALSELLERLDAL